MTEAADSPSIPPPPTPTLILESIPPNEPPPPYPSRERRRMIRAGRRRRTVGPETDHHLQVPSGHSESEYDFVYGHPPSLGGSPFPLSADVEHEATEATPLLISSNSPRLPPGGISSRQRTLSITSTTHSVTSIAPSFAQTVLSAFHPERDCDLDPDVEHEHDHDSDGRDSLDSPTPQHFRDEHSLLFAARPSSPRVGRRTTPAGMWRRYFRPMVRRAYYSALFHLLFLNFPYALVAWLYLFVFTLAGTTTLMALPLGAVLCFLDLLGARTFARGELALQTTFHGPLAFPTPYPPHPIFTRMRNPTTSELEAGIGPTKERSFYRNAYAMFTDWTSYQALFYFLVIKPGITILISLALIALVPLSFALVFPAPAMLRLVRRLGIWQANIAVDGLYCTVR